MPSETKRKNCWEKYATGGANFHGIHEFVSADAMEKMVRVLTALSR